MKTDFSFLLFEKVFQQQNREVQVTFTSAKKVTGKIISFVRAEYDDAPFAIIKWRIVNTSTNTISGIDAFGISLGELVNTADIASVYFTQDNSQLTNYH